jgi:MoaA/NifB/PqqE/SkfB family radical SAM enzyme
MVAGQALRHGSYTLNYGMLRPSIISISMTIRCNSRCPTCSYWKDTSNRQELSAENWKTIITRIKKWYGPFQFALGGGEPLIRKDIETVIAHAVKLGCRPSIVTNGLLLSRDRIAALIDAGLEEIVLSLNGIKAETHDFTRGVPGGFAKIMTAVDEIKKYDDRVTVGIACVLMGYNLDEAAEMTQWVKEAGLDRIKFQALFFETGNNYYEENWFKNSVLWKSRTGSIADHMDGLIRLKKAGYPIANSEKQMQHFKAYFLNPNNMLPVACKIGVHGFFIEPNGDVKLCYMFAPVGNIADMTPATIWNSNQARQIRKRIKNCRLNCRLKNCNYTA